jgi:hypothetical protein
MAVAQSAIYDAQAEVQNGYVVHPDLDGCTPRTEPDGPGPLH